MSLAGKIVAVVGGGTGIGAGIASELSMAGANVTVGGRRMEPLQQLSDVTDSAIPIRTHTIDVADNASIEAFFADLRAEVVKLIFSSIAPESTSPNEQWRRWIPTNGTASFASTQLAPIAACIRSCRPCEIAVTD